jgi:hypothetical protein
MGSDYQDIFDGALGMEQVATLSGQWPRSQQLSK